MKLDQQAITNLLTLVIFIGTLIGWGMMLESRISESNVSVQAYQKVQDVRWEENSRRLDAMRRDLQLVENRLRRDEE